MSDALTQSELLMSGSLVRAYVKTFTDWGQLERVLERVSTATRHALQKPPFAWVWIDGEPGLETLTVLEQLRGTKEVERFGLDMARNSLGPLVTPILRTLLSVSSASPRLLFANLAFLNRPFSRGIDFSLTDVNPKRVELTVTYPRVPAPAVYPFWAGVLQHGYDLTRAEGTAAFRTAPDGKSARFELSWG